MSKPPFSRPFSLTQSQHTTAPPLRDGTDSNSPAVSPTATRHILPAAVQCGNTLERTSDDPDTFYARELRTVRLDKIQTYLWIVGLPTCSRALHRQILLGREILITEDVDEHLVWHEARIFIKPLPTFLFSTESWEQQLCKDRELYEAACGFMLSYAWLVRHESDLRIAHEKGLLPDAVDWASWTAFVGDFLNHIDLQSLDGISPRFQYGELRLSRLNKIYRFTLFNWRNVVRGYMSTSTWYQDFFARNFSWLLAVFAILSVALSAMQVVLTMARGGQAFANASYGFSIASLLVAAGSVLVGLLVWVTLFVYYMVSTAANNRKVINERRSFAVVKERPTVEVHPLRTVATAKVR